jgi:dTDP-D-glucose 4,6-dehydratase
MIILFTGGTGFVGTNFVFNHLNYNDYIIIYDKLTYAGNKNIFVSLGHNNKFLFIEGNDKDLSINWDLENISILSQDDAKGKNLKYVEYFK